MREQYITMRIDYKLLFGGYQYFEEKLDYFWRRSLKMWFFMEKNTGIRRVSEAGLREIIFYENRNLLLTGTCFRWLSYKTSQDTLFDYFLVKTGIDTWLILYRSVQKTPVFSVFLKKPFFFKKSRIFLFCLFKIINLMYYKIYYRISHQYNPFLLTCRSSFITILIGPAFDKTCITN